MQNIERIQRLSSTMQWLCRAAIALIPVCIVWAWLDFERFAPVIAGPNMHALQMEHIGPLNLAMGLIVSSIPAGVLVVGLYRLQALFGLYRRARFFTETNVRHLRAFAICLFVNALLLPLTGSALSVVLTMSNPPGERMLNVSVSSSHIATAFMGAVFMIIAGIMLEGRRLADENAEIV